MKKYREDFLTKVRYTSTDLNQVNKSWFQYAEVSPGVWGLSILGALNLEPFPWRIQVKTGDDNVILGYRLGKRGY